MFVCEGEGNEVEGETYSVKSLIFIFILNSLPVFCPKK